uniref:Uncharacterized protein n=1 Tax=Glycine max TaxID=3847 RepID=A0A0R0L7X7_SOYBN
MMNVMLEVQKIQPRRTPFTSMMHLQDHEEVNDFHARLFEVIRHICL